MQWSLCEPRREAITALREEFRCGRDRLRLAPHRKRADDLELTEEILKANVV